MKSVTTKYIGFITCFVLLTALFHQPSTAQPTLVAEICPGTQGSITLFNDTAKVEEYLYFAADDCVSGKELWRTDGTPGGTEMVADIFDGSSGSNPEFLTNVEGILFFSADDGIHGPELWKFDPNTEKAEMVADIYRGRYGSGPSYLIQFQGQVFFFASAPSVGNELWRSDGTEYGTEMVKEIRPGPNTTVMFDMLVANDLLFFWGYEGTYGREIWRSDGTENGTEIVRDIFPGSQDALVVTYPFTLYGITYRQSAKLTKIGDRVFFFASDGISGSELWASDGTKAGTVLVKDINPGPDSSYPSELVYMEDFLLLAAADATHGRELHMLDAQSFDNITFDINPGAADSSPKDITANTGGIVVFNADDGTHGRELWQFGKKYEPMLVADINSGPSDGNPSNFYFDDRFSNSPDEDMLIYKAWTPANGGELWASTLTPPFNTDMVYEFRAGSSFGPIRDFTRIGSYVVFLALGTGNGAELWRLDDGNGFPFLKYDDADIELKIESPDEAPTAFTLAQNYPNPFNPSTVIDFTVPESAHVHLSVFDMLGREVRTLVDGVLSTGRHQVTFSANDLPSGTYLYRIEAPGFTSTKVMHLAK